MTTPPLTPAEQMSLSFQMVVQAFYRKCQDDCQPLYEEVQQQIERVKALGIDIEGLR